MTSLATASPHLLEIDDLHVEFRTREGIAHAVNGVTYYVDAGEMLAVLGESGSGKSVTAQCIMGILDSPPGVITKGQIRLNGANLLDMSERQLRAHRGRQVAMIFQDALSALNPVMSVGAQIAEMFIGHKQVGRHEARRRAVALMEQVQIPAATRRADDYPHQLSGGMRQRIMIAMALALDPSVLIADEPTTALDVTIQAQILELLDDLRRERQMAVVLITHDLAVVGEVADRVAVMYAGRIVEEATVDQAFGAPMHPYTRALIDSIPTVSQNGSLLQAIPGQPPNLLQVPTGCPFHPRCPRKQNVCVATTPPRRSAGAGHSALCHFPVEDIHANS